MINVILDVSTNIIFNNSDDINSNSIFKANKIASNVVKNVFIKVVMETAGMVYYFKQNVIHLLLDLKKQ